MAKLSSALIAEFIGTFALVFIGAGAGALGAGGLVGVAFAHGLILTGFIYAVGDISGTHVNPAVTIAVLAAGKIEAARAAAYVVVQLAGGLAGAWMLSWVLGGTESGLGATTLASTVNHYQGFAVEMILTFFLASVVLHAAVSGKAGPPFGLAIGLTLAAAILMGGPLTGASLNPARTLGPAVLTGNTAELWVYFAGPIAGGLLAAGVWRLLRR
jgi:MIP family channel proteins